MDFIVDRFYISQIGKSLYICFSFLGLWNYIILYQYSVVVSSTHCSKMVNNLLEAINVFIVGAHPDDLEYSCAALMQAAKGNIWAAYITDGGNGKKGLEAKIDSDGGEELRSVRVQESISAMQLLGVSNLEFYGFEDLDTHNSIAKIIVRIYESLQRIKPDIMVTHTMEGGHPDHDITRFCAGEAAAWYKELSGHQVEVWEFAGYNLFDGKVNYKNFIPNGNGTVKIPHTDPDLWIKAMRMHESQWYSLKKFVDANPGFDMFRQVHNGKLVDFDAYHQIAWDCPVTPEMVSEAIKNYDRETVKSMLLQ